MGQGSESRNSLTHCDRTHTPQGGARILDFVGEDLPQYVIKAAHEAHRVWPKPPLPTLEISSCP